MAISATASAGDGVGNERLRIPAPFFDAAKTRRADRPLSSTELADRHTTLPHRASAVDVLAAPTDWLLAMKRSATPRPPFAQVSARLAEQHRVVVSDLLLFGGVRASPTDSR
jgi:hypothetical protein